MPDRYLDISEAIFTIGQGQDKNFKCSLSTR